MRILGVFDKLAPALADRAHLLGGAERTALAHFRGLEQRLGHDCRVVTPADVRRVGRVRGVRVSTYRDTEELKAILRRLHPQAVLSNLDRAYEAAALAHSLEIPHFALLDSFECCEPSLFEKKRWGVSLQRTYMPREQAAFALRSSARVLACSGYLARRLKKRHGICAGVLYPSFDAAEMLLPPAAAGRGEFITGICGFRWKGALVFLALCRRFRREPFLLAGGVDPELRPLFEKCANLTLAPSLSTPELLRRSRIVLVPSQWQEPFGRIAVEAMANGIPLLASSTGGLREIVGGSALAVKPFRDAAAWAAALRRLLESPEAQRANGATGRKKAARFLGNGSVTALDRLLRSAAKRPRRHAAKPRRRTVAIVGSDTVDSAFSLINARLADELEHAGGYRVIRCADAAQTGIGDVDCFVHHDYQIEFAELRAPAQGRWVAIRTWDFGAYPPAWSAKIREECDRLWVPSRWSKSLAMRGGVPSRRVAVIPWGVDPKIFSPHGRRHRPATHKRFIFLFVGAAVYRKGVDILLEAYRSAFTRADDVCLVIKTHGADVFYRDIDMRRQIHALQSDAAAPEIVLLDELLGERELASLYRACDAGVFPYRAEGFALPILEAMACGLPSIVPEFGACLDYCSPAASFRVPVRRVHLPVAGSFQFNTLGFREPIDEVDFCEMPAASLAAEMRRVASLPDAGRQQKAEEGVRISHGRFTWADTAARVIHELDSLMRRALPLRIAAARRRRAAAATLLASARNRRG